VCQSAALFLDSQASVALAVLKQDAANTAGGVGWQKIPVS
jgi:hypothetical protein